MIDELKLIEWLKGKKYITVNENSTEMTGEFEKNHQWELSRNCFINKVIKFIGEQPKLNEWIPCSERLPEETDYPEQRFRVLASCSDGIVRNATIKSLRNTEEEHRSRGNFFTYVAWQPLPEPYREKV